MTGRTDPGLAGLWRQSRKCNKLAASWKFIEDLANMKIGNNEVERDAWNRAANRIVKRGKERPRLKGKYGTEIKRDAQYVATHMKVRARQAKKDWEAERALFMSMKRKLLEKGTEQ